MSLPETVSYLPTPARLVDVVPESADTRTFVVELAGDAGWSAPRPGQFVMLSLLGHGEAAFTVASRHAASDVPQHLCLTIRRVGALTGALFALAPGSTLGLRGPFGHGFPAYPADAALLFVAGGCGLAPLRSAIEECLATRREGTALSIVYGAREPAARILRRDLERWRALPDVLLRDPVEHPDVTWQGERGSVPEALARVLAARRPDFVAACGPPAMLRAVARDLAAAHVPLEDVSFAIERQMKCGVGLCGRCYVGQYLTCTDGPVFTLQQLARIDPTTAGGLAPLTRPAAC